MTYHQLQLEDRRVLEKLHQQRHSYRSIAKILQVSHSTVSREVQDKINSRPKKVLGFATPKSHYKKLLTNSSI